MCAKPAAALALIIGGLVAAPSEAQVDTEAQVQTTAKTPDQVPADPASPDESASSTGAGEKRTPAARNRFIEEIVVTAQKREENLQDVPISVQAFSGELLDAKGITDPTDLPMITPGLTYSNLVSYSMIYIRGVGTDAFIPSFDLSVATYVDGIYMPFASGLAQSFGTLERIEVLKGPQGTLFGRNATGGAINIITKKPSFTEFEALGDISYASFDDLQTKAHVSVPLTDQLAFSLSGVYNSSGLYYKSVNQKLADDISKGGRGKLRWSPIEGLDLTFAAAKIQSQGAGSALGANVSPKPSVTTLGQSKPPDYVTEINDPAYSSNSTTIYQFDGTWNLSRFDTRVILADQRIRAVTALDFDETALPLVSFSHPKGFSDMRTAELQFVSNQESWGADWFTYIGGLYYLESSAGYDPLELYVGVRQLEDTFGGPGASLDQAILGPLLDRFPGGPAPFTVVSRGVVDTEAKAVFFQGTAKITEQISATVGGRFQEEERALVKSTVGNYAAPGEVVMSFPLSSNKDSNFSPKLSLDFRPMDDLLIYGSYTQGFKSGSYNIVNIYTASNYVKPEKVTAYELGAKTEFLDSTLRLNGAIFQNEVDNLQVQIISLTSGGAVAVENAGKARIRGVELDLTWTPGFEAAPGLVTTLGAAYLDGKYLSFPNGSGYDETTGAFFGPRAATGAATPGRNFKGHRINQTPDFTGTASIAYSWDLGYGTVEAASDFYYNSGYFYSAQNSSRNEQDAYHLVNARLSYLHAPWNTRITLFGKNLTSEHYYLYKLENDFGTAGLLQPEATYGVRLSWEIK